MEYLQRIERGLSVKERRECPVLAVVRHGRCMWPTFDGDDQATGAAWRGPAGATGGSEKSVRDNRTTASDDSNSLRPDSILVRGFPRLKDHLYRRRRLFVAFCILAVSALAVAIALAMHAGRLAHSAVSLIGHFGPGLFFSAMALLPAFGFPLAVFNLSAGPMLVPTLGLLPTVAWASLAIAVNVGISYALARYFVRPPVLRLLSWLGYSVPDWPRRNAWSFAFLVRVLPGPPFVFQSYLLGSAKTPIFPYMTVSWIVATAYSALSIVGMDALHRRDARDGLFVLAMFGVLALILRLYRRRIAPSASQAPGESGMPASVQCGEERSCDR